MPFEYNIPADERKRFEKWTNKNGWARVYSSEYCFVWKRGNQLGSDKWLYGSYLMENSKCTG